MRIKSFRNAKIEALQPALSQMDLSRYKNIILHVGGHDIDGEIILTAFREKYRALLSSVTHENSEIFVSGLLPRGGTNMKPFNDFLKDVCEETKSVYIDNHDFFTLASGALLVDFYHGDKVSFRFPGIRTSVHNLHDSCPVLSKKQMITRRKSLGNKSR